MRSSLVVGLATTGDERETGVAGPGEAMESNRTERDREALEARMREGSKAGTATSARASCTLEPAGDGNGLWKGGCTVVMVGASLGLSLAHLIVAAKVCRSLEVAGVWS